ncbi:MAG: MiaB/RimO family radical SAM methylthiotransferase [Candidatus Omnitrophota bacterium]|jgi:threonylcarbamoyladenosine tRNA methylthiotransferase MtaB
MKTIKFFTLGCKVNQYDTQSIREAFLGKGFREGFLREISDYCLINTCTVTASADKKSCNIIRRCLKTSPKSKVIVTGCMVKKDSGKLSKIKGINLIISRGFFPERISDFSNHTRAFLKVQDGCNNFCSYCKVPKVRGLSRSRKPGEIIKEALRLARKGFKEIVLTGICLGAYGRDLKPKTDLVYLIEKLENVRGILRIRLSSIEAGDVSDDLIKRISLSDKLCPHLHIPIQSGDDAILKRMNRKYTSGDYLALIKKLNKEIPGIAITTDVLVGFPGEKKVNFNNTVRLIKKIRPLKVHIFPYSKREGTQAAGFDNLVCGRQIRERVSELKKLSVHLSKSYRNDFNNKEKCVLIEAGLKNKPGFWEGFTDNYLRVIVKSDFNLKNRLIPLKLKKLSTEYSLEEKGKFCLTNQPSSTKL